MFKKLGRLLNGPPVPKAPPMSPEERRLADAFARYFYILRVDEFLNPTFKDRCDNAAHEFNDAVYEYVKARAAAEQQ